MLAVIFIASLLPTEHLPKVANDKLEHFLSYFILAWWSSLAFQVSTLKKIIILALALIFFGGLIELLQGLTGYRYAEWYDLLANTLGITGGCFMAYFVTDNILNKMDYFLSQ